MLFGIIKRGLVPPYAPADYVSDMPAFGSVLSDSEIAAVLAYVKSRWPEEQRAYQAEMTAKVKR